MDKNLSCNTLDIFRVIATIQVFLGHVITHFAMSNPPIDAIYFIRGVPIFLCFVGFWPLNLWTLRHLGCGYFAERCGYCLLFGCAL